jgi:mono/diheme cytochrome c family protein
MSRVNAIAGAAWVMAVAVAGAQAPTPRIWQGVYTSAQADRGKAVYETSCVRCHGADLGGTSAPSLKGDRFMSTWGGENVSRLFEKIRDTMPPLFGTFVSDDAKMDIVGYILQSNGYPAGKTELAAGPGLASIQIVGKGDLSKVQNFALVRLVGCLFRAETGWRLNQSAEPVPTTTEPPGPEVLAQAAAQPLGTGDYLLLNASPFDPASHQGRKVEARGLIYTEPGDGRLTVTALKSLGPCS